VGEGRFRDCCDVDNAIRGNGSSKSSIFSKSLRDLHARGFGEEQNSVKGHLSNRGLDLFRRVEGTFPLPSTPEARAIPRNVTKGRVEEGMEMLTFTRNRRLGGIKQFLEPGLLIQSIDQREGSNHVLGLDDPPALALKGPELRLERVGSRDSR
jgi:hypothetical protein